VKYCYGTGSSMTHRSKQVYAITLRKAQSFMKAQGFDPVELLANTELSEGDLAEPYSERRRRWSSARTQGIHDSHHTPPGQT
jgi:hypothetical protein